MWRSGLVVVGVLGIAAPCVAGRAGQAPSASPTVQQSAAKQPTDVKRPADVKQPSGRLTPDGKLEIVRAVDGEFAKVVQPLPSIKPGFKLKPGQKIDQEALQSALMRSLPAANPGDTVQITNIEFHSKEILFEINGGSSPHESWRQRIHISLGGSLPTTRVVKDQPPGLVNLGSTLILEFDGPVPSLTPAQVKKYLAPFLNFAGQRSAAESWVQTLDPKFQKAIQEHVAVIGMDRDMVLAALGRADHKVREYTPDGTETEDWIYGRPPGTTIFVTFIGNDVVRVQSYP